VPFISSFGTGEFGRYLVEEHASMGQKFFCLDVAHGAQTQVAEQTIRFKKNYPDLWLMVGNFGSPESIVQFLDTCQYYEHFYQPNAIKVGIGPGSACTTRIKTGVGYPQLSAINDIKNTFEDLYKDAPAIIADGGIKTPGDVAKALACGANAVMIGGMLAGTDETPGEIIQVHDKQFKQYRGSASKESYETQGKDWDCAEGESFTVQYKGSALNVLKDIEGGLKSAFSYVGAKNLKEFQKMSEFIIVSSNTVKENNSHGKNNS
jgi:IMP dehydrogenase/GMP reductase